MKKTSKLGFTLIELLVVVLIIGILAAVAVPQYQLAVEKSKAASIISLLKNIYNAQQVYYLANQEYATRYDVLDIQIPSGGEYSLNNTVIDYADKRRLNLCLSCPSIIGYPNTDISYYIEFYFSSKRRSCWAGKDSSFGNKICRALTGHESVNASTTMKEYRF